MLDFLSMSCLTSLGDVMTMLVAGPNFREYMPPYSLAHLVNLVAVSLGLEK